MTLVLGVDGGNSKTVALVARRDGTILGWGRAGCGDIYGAPSAAEALAAIEGAVVAALTMAGACPGDLAAGGFSLAGADWPEDLEYLRDQMLARGYGHRAIVVNDAVGALWAGNPDGVGVVVNCGTGAAIAARAEDGTAWHGSFWLEGMGSEALGQRALRAVLRAELGIDPPTALTPCLLTFYDQPTVEALLHLFTARLGNHPNNRDRLARVVLDTAEAGDETARGLVATQGVILADYALAAVRQVGLSGRRFPLVLAGGIFRHPSRLLPKAISDHVQAAEPGATPLVARLEPVAGALLLALRSLDPAPDDALIERLAASMPGAVFFATA